MMPVGNLCVCHSGEPHAPSDQLFVSAPALYQMLYVAPEEMTTAASEIAERQISELPYFPQILTSDEKLIAEFLNLFSVINPLDSQLKRDEARLSFLSCLITRHAQNQFGVPAFKSNSAAVRRAKDFLHANFLLDFSLDEIAVVAGVNKFYLCRAFRRQIGVSPHAFQTHLRIAHAKKLLLQDFSAAEVAALTGFYDQSHFGKYFKRLVGVSPKSYISDRSIFS